MNYLQMRVNQLLMQRTMLTCSRNVNSKAFFANRESKTMKKLLQGKFKTKRIWHIDNETPKLPTIASIANPTSQAKTSLRRVHVLNKLFMRYITDLMATGGEWSGYGLEISRVKITTDFRIVNIYWLARGDGSDEVLESKLSKAAGPLKHNLSQLRLMGEVPTIKFVKDRQYAKITEVETLLRRADFGEDFIPLRESQIVINDLSCNTIQHSNAIPELTHDIFGLNQAKIMSQVVQNMSKAKQAWEKLEIKIPENIAGRLVQPEERKEAIVKLKEEELQEFLKQRRNRKSRILKSRADHLESVNENEDEDDLDQLEERDYFEDDFEIEKQ